MSAERGQANTKMLVVVLVLLVAALAAWFFVGLRNRESVVTEQTMTGTVEEQPAEAEPVADAGGAAATTESAPSDPVPAAAESATRPLPRLLDLGAGTCVPCKMMAPILDEMKVTFDGQLDVEFIDVRKDNTAARQYGIQVIPTQIFFDPDGKELFRHQGFFSREDMLAKWKELGYEFAG